MTDPAPTNGNGRKGANRRYRVGLLIIALGTISYYVVILKRLALEYFVEYGKFLLLVGLFVVAGISATDAITKWRNGNGGAK